jgi:hypothetical protein
MEKIKDISLLTFWGTAYMLKTIVELPYLWIKSKFK